MKNMSLERVIETLVRLGLSRSEAEVYVYLANKGPHKAVSIAHVLRANKSTAYDNLKKLQTKNLVTKNNAIYSALPFEQALELLIKREKKQANHFQESTKKLVATWKKDK